MKQVIQHLKSGAIAVEEVPSPSLRAPGVLVATACSVISPGTERAAVELGRSSLLGKALRRPDQVRKVLESLRRDGLSATFGKVRQRLDASRAMGYSCAGVVLESRECDLPAGARVACAGTDAATHAEINFAPRNLCAEIPRGVGFEEAAFGALGGIAMHAAHLSGAQVGEDVAVVGLGALGLLTLQTLAAAGCRAHGFDLREDRLALARELGAAHAALADASQLSEIRHMWRRAHGFDRVFITAASADAAPVEWAVEAARDRGTIVVVGDVRTHFPRSACYAKELTIVYARSYGPGRYDPLYEERGVEYPRGQVPFNIRRNLAAFLNLVARGSVNVSRLITHRLPVAEAARAYEIVSGAEPSLGVVLKYPLGDARPDPAVTLRPPRAAAKDRARIGCIGAGSYAAGVLFPLLKRSGAEMVSVVATRGVSARKAAEEFGFSRAATDPRDVLDDAEVDAVVIATRHDSHAALALAALAAGKAVLVEKPLCLSEEELERIVEAAARSPQPVMVGFNRRYAPATRALAEFFERAPGAASPRDAAPLSIQYSVHAGALPEGHWLRNPAQGGRIRGEVCHFVDWCCWMTGAAPEKVFAAARGSPPDEILHAVLQFPGGSAASIVYDTSAHAALPKEVVEVSCAGRSAVVENFSRAVLLSSRGRRSFSFSGKGQAEMVAAFLAAPIGECGFALAAASTRATLKLVESASTGLSVWL
jgi:predicted dehydrogenase/threonine dehydrogenase-like Zn-dependent dehydrogenase